MALLISVALAAFLSTDGGQTPPVSAPTSDLSRFVRLGTAKLKSSAATAEIALLVDGEAGRRAFPALAMRSGGRDHARLTTDDHAQMFVLWGHFAKLITLRSDAKLSSGDLKQLLEEALQKGFKEPPHDLPRITEALAPLYAMELAPNEEIVLRTSSSGQLVAERPGETHLLLRNPKLLRLWWTAWLGEHAPTRRTLVDHIDLLGQ